MTSAFDALGYLSADVEDARRALRDRHSADIAKVEALCAEALGDLAEIEGDRTQAFLVGLGFWLRCIEACQGAVLLIERGLPTAPFPVLRTAFECLFFACALWRNPGLAERLQVGHDVERVKQAKAMIAAGAASRIPAERVLDLESVAAEATPLGSGLSVWEAAVAADLRHEYETAYRGFGIAGAHASLRSLDDYFDERADGSFTLRFEPNSSRTAWLLGLVATCLKGGVDRCRQARS